MLVFLPVPVKPSLDSVEKGASSNLDTNLSAETESACLTMLQESQAPQAHPIPKLSLRSKFLELGIQVHKSKNEKAADKVGKQSN